MKSILVMLAVLTFGIKGFAQLDAREKELDLETETLEIHDLEAEQKTAAEEAKRQEAEERKLQIKLQLVKNKKETTLERAKREVAESESRRTHAESQQKKYAAAILKYQKETQKLEQQIKLYNDSAKRAEAIAEAGKKEVNRLWARRIKLLKLVKQSGDSDSKSKLKATNLKKQYQNLNNQNRQLESRLPASQRSSQNSDQKSN